MVVEIHQEAAIALVGTAVGGIVGGEGLRFRELEQLRDIDTLEDAKAVAVVNPWTRCSTALRELGQL